MDDDATSSGGTPASDAAAAPPSPRWSEPGVGQPWQLRFFDGLLRRLGKRPAYHMMYLVTFWYCLFSPTIRRRTRHYLDRRFPARRGVVRRFLDSHRLLRSFGKTLVDLAAFRILGPASFSLAGPGAARLAELARSAGGMILVNAHVGGWQVALPTLAHLRKPAALVMLPTDRHRFPLDPETTRIIDPRTGLAAILEMMQALRNGEVLCLMGDRVFGDDPHALWLPFLGAPAEFPVAAYRLASATGVPVVLLLTRKRDFRTYEVQAAEVCTLPPGLGREAAAYAPWAGIFVAALERFVQEHPWDYFNFFDVWSPRPPEGPP
jgi:predicted LPLAT superfamily acyltransferase